MTEREPGIPPLPRLMVTVLGVLTTAAPFVLSPVSVGGVLLVAAGLLGCVAAAAGRLGGATLVGAAAIGQLAVPAHAGVAAVLVTAALLGLLLAAVETADSGRWRAGWGELVAAHLVPVCLGVTLTAAAVLVAILGSRVTSPGTAAAMLGTLAAAAGVGIATVRVRPPQ